MRKVDTEGGRGCKKKEGRETIGRQKGKVEKRRLSKGRNRHTLTKEKGRAFDILNLYL